MTLLQRYRALGADRVVALWLAVWWVCNLLTAAGSELADDEAYYWMFAQALDWGYFDHPPMTALLVFLGDRWCAGSLGVRLAFTLLQPLYLWILWRLIRPQQATRREAELYTILAAATLLLQLYGFIAVPDGPLLATAVLFLWALQRFAEHRRAGWLWLGIAMAAMAYSKYHGALVVIFALAANPSLLRRAGLYGAGALTLLLLLPHLYWQYSHDWASFAYHLAGRNNAFDASYPVEFIINLLLVFNPFLMPLYLYAWRKVKPTTAVERTLRWLPPAFVCFFLFSSLRGYVQPQWVIVAVFGWLYTLFHFGRQSSRAACYMTGAGLVTVALVMVVRIVMVFNPIGLKFEVFDNRASYTEIAAIAEGRPVLFRNGYSVAAKYSFYTGGESYCQPNIYYRTHHWQFRDDDTRFAGREVVQELNDRSEVDTTRYRTGSMTLRNGRTFTWAIVPDFRPTRRVNIEVTGLPAQCRVGDRLHLHLRLENPYDYPIAVGERATLRLLWKEHRFRVEEFPLPTEVALPAQGTAEAEVDFTVPDLLRGAGYTVAFTVAEAGTSYWFQGKTHHVTVE